MGYVFCLGTCANCGKTFSFNPVRVPSVRINGTREPICRSCIEGANPVRKANGLAEIEIMPDAYEACEESEI